MKFTFVVASKMRGTERGQRVDDHQGSKEKRGNGFLCSEAGIPEDDGPEGE
jgi:hypothetical protein